MRILFFILLGTLTYVFALFPLALTIIGILSRKKTEPAYIPTISILIPTRNDENHIRSKIMNAIDSDYPKEKIEILVGSDGSTDGTVKEIQSFDDDRIHLTTLSKREGKTSVINKLAEQANSDVLVMSDSDVILKPDAIKELVKHFADPKIGAVCGNRSNPVADNKNASKGAKLYNLYEGAIKEGEGALGRVIGADGSLYAIRRQEFKPIPPNVPDDFVTILGVLKNGNKVIYEKAAIAFEELQNSSSDDFVRKRRTVARGIRGLLSAKALLNPFRFPLISFLLISHKIVRWFAGIIMLILFVTNALLISQPLFLYFFFAQLVFYTMVISEKLFRKTIFAKLFKILRYFTLTNIAAGMGLIDVLRGKEWLFWDMRKS